MSTKKTSTKKAAASTGRSRAELRRQLAHDLSAILNNPAAPDTLRNAIGGELSEFETAMMERDAKTPAWIERALECYELAEKEVEADA